MTARRITLSEAELEAMMERAAKSGAHEALSELGLFDIDDRPAAARDIKDLRDILKVFKDIQTNAVKGLFAWIGRGIIAVMIFGAVVWMARGGIVIEAPK
ncbi:MAG: DUF6127 family protein [Pseudomonadota bacterium]|jgi:hypothetical protein